MATQEKGKKNRKYGRNKKKGELWRAAHGGGTRHKFIASKEHRGCGPLGYFMRARALLDAKYGSLHSSQEKGTTFNTRIRIK